MTPRLNIIVAGLIGQYPIGGVTWDYIQYVLGLASSDTTSRIWKIPSSGLTTPRRAASAARRTTTPRMSTV